MRGIRDPTAEYWLTTKLKVGRIKRIWQIPNFVEKVKTGWRSISGPYVSDSESDLPGACWKLEKCAS